MATSKFHDIRAGLKTIIDARLTTDAVTGVTVLKYTPRNPAEYTREDLVWFGTVTTEQSQLAFGTARDERLRIDGYVYAPKSGGSLTEADEAEARAETIFDSIQTAIVNSDTINGVMLFGEVETVESNVEYDDKGPFGIIQFTVAGVANL